MVRFGVIDIQMQTLSAPGTPHGLTRKTVILLATRRRFAMACPVWLYGLRPSDSLGSRFHELRRGLSPDRAGSIFVPLGNCVNRKRLLHTTSTR